MYVQLDGSESVHLRRGQASGSARLRKVLPGRLRHLQILVICGILLLLLCTTVKVNSLRSVCWIVHHIISVEQRKIVQQCGFPFFVVWVKIWPDHFKAKI